MSSNPIDADFDAVVKESMKSWHVSGLSISVTHNEDTWSKGYGVAQRSPEIETEPSTLFYAASTTKAQLCAVWEIYIQSEANKSKPETERISWSTPLVEIIRDDFVLEDPQTTRQITLEDAVSHRTGMTRHDLCYGKEGPSTVKDVTRHLRHLPLLHEIRTKFEYCNTMYMAATHALETVTGKRLSQILREWLWEPLGMHHTYLGYREAHKSIEADGGVLAKAYYWTELPGSHEYDNGSYKEQPYMDFPEVSGAGEVISTADDYAKWMRCLLSASSPLSDDMKKELWTSRTIARDMVEPFDGKMLNYGLGWFIGAYRGYKCVWHPGGIIGAGSLVMLVPELKWGCSFFGNGNDVGATLRGLPFVLLDKVIGEKDEQKQTNANARVEKEVKKQLADLGEEFGKGRKKLYPNAPPKPTIPLSLPFEAYAGTYRSKAYGRITFSAVEEENSVGGKDASKRLTFLMTNKTWVSRLTLEHINAEFWLGRKELSVSPIHRPFKAESKVGIDGKVEAFGLVMEDSMPDTLIWFTREA